MTGARAKQIGYLHALAARAGMDEETRRDFLQAQTGKRSSKELTVGEAAAVIDKLAALAGGSGARGAVAGLDSAVAKKLRALWIAAHDLGLLHDRSDRALLAFVERQTKVSHTRFLREPGQGAAAIEALKAWLAREGGVAWPEVNDATCAKRAVLAAQWARLVALVALGAVDAGRPGGEGEGLEAFAFRLTDRGGWRWFENEHYTAVQRALGRKLRAALAKRGTAA